MLKRISNPQDFLAGVMFAVIATIALYESAGLQFGSLMRMGPGFFPIVLAAILMIFAAALILRGLAGPERSVELFLSRRALAIVVATVAFGVLIGPLGFVPALVVLVVASSFANPDLSWADTIKLAAVLTVSSVVVFVYLLRQPLVLLSPYLTGF